MFDSLMSIANSDFPDYGTDIALEPKPISITPGNNEPVPQEFFADIMALTLKFGILRDGQEIEIPLREALEIMPRRRERSDAYNKLQKYLHTARNIVLTIRSNKNGKKENC